MSAVDELLANNRRHAGVLEERHVDVRPSRALTIVTCMDSRLDVYAALGLGAGDAHVLRNAGGVITDDVLRSLAISQRLLGTREVMLIQHTDCGVQRLGDEGFRQAAGLPEELAVGAFTDVEQSVRDSIRRVRESPFLAHRDAVRGFVYDVETHRLREVMVPAS